MAWSHCEQSILDDQACPGCGLSKAEWTVQVDVTRTFEVKRATRKRKARDAWIEVQLLGDDGSPRAGAAYRIALPSSRVKKGELDSDGVVRIEEIREGECQVSFPGVIETPELRATGERHVFGGPREPVRFRFSW